MQLREAPCTAMLRDGHLGTGLAARAAVGEGQPLVCLHSRGGSGPQNAKPTPLPPNGERSIGINKPTVGCRVVIGDLMLRENAEQFNTPFHVNCPSNLTALFFRGQGNLTIFFLFSIHK